MLLLVVVEVLVAVALRMLPGSFPLGRRGLIRRKFGKLERTTNMNRQLENVSANHCDHRVRPAGAGGTPDLLVERGYGTGILEGFELAVSVAAHGSDGLIRAGDVELIVLHVANGLAIPVPPFLERMDCAVSADRGGRGHEQRGREMHPARRRN